MDSATFSGLGQGLNQATGTMLSTGMQLNKLQADEQIRRDTLAMHQQQMNQSALQHQQTLAIAQQQANTAQEHLPPSRLPFNETTLNGLKNKFLLQGLPKDVADNILSPLEPMAKDQNMYRGDIANRLEQGWDSTFKPNIIAQLKTYSNGLAEKLGKMEQTDPNYKKLSTQLDKTDKIMGAFESITPEKVIPGFFPDIFEERENTKAALQASKGNKTPENENNWIATLNDPNTSPAQKALAKLNIDTLQKGREDLASKRIPDKVFVGFDEEGKPIGYSRRTGDIATGNAPENTEKNMVNWIGLKKAALTSNSPVFKRLVNNSEILAVGVKDPTTGKMRPAELDQIIKMRDNLDDKTFAKISSDVVAFNKLDQWLNYQTSNPKQAALVSKVMAASDTLGSVYAGGGTVTSDFKMQFAKEMFETGLSKTAFRAKLNAHKQSILDRMYKFNEISPAGKNYNTENNDSGLPAEFKPGW